MAKKKGGDDYGLSKHGSETSLDAALVACINNITDIIPSKVVIDVHKQLIVKFQPAVKSVADTGFNLLRAFHNVQKMSEAYVKSIDMLAESGNSAFPAARQRAVELKELASYMREVNRRHKETIGKFSLLVTKVNAYGHDEKEKLKEFHRSYEAREKAMKKSLHKKKQHDPDAMEKFYVKERNLALRQQYQRYKFFVERHNEWLRDYMSLFGAFKQMFGELPIPETFDNAVNKEDEAGHKNAIFDDEGYVAPYAFGEKTDSLHADNLSQKSVSELSDVPKVVSTCHVKDEVPKSVPNNEAFFNENFTVQRSEPEVAAPVLSPDQTDSSDVIIRYRDTKNQASTADKAINVMPAPSMLPTEVVRFRDAATTTDPYENYPQEPLEPPGHISGRPSSYREPTLQPIPAVRRNISDRIASLSMTALNDGPNVREPPSKGVMFRPSNINAVPTAFVQQPFMAADYGKMLVCIHNFHGQTANQLSLKAGEKVILIKCGSKGWVFTKHVESQRTGWFPSRYVQILPDSPVTTQL